MRAVALLLAALACSVMPVWAQWQRTSPFTTSSEPSQVAYGNGVYVQVGSAFTGGGFAVLVFTSTASDPTTAPWDVVVVPGPDDSNGVQLFWWDAKQQFVLIGWQSAITSTDGVHWTTPQKFAGGQFITVNPTLVRGGTIYALDDTSFAPYSTTDLVHWQSAGRCGFEFASYSLSTQCFFSQPLKNTAPDSSFDLSNGHCASFSIPIPTRVNLVFVDSANGNGTVVAVPSSSSGNGVTFYGATDCATYSPVGTGAHLGGPGLFQLLTLPGSYLWLPTDGVDTSQASMSKDLSKWVPYTPTPSTVLDINPSYWNLAGGYMWVTNVSSDNAYTFGLYYASSDATNFVSLPGNNVGYPADLLEFNGAYVLLDAYGITTSTDGSTWQRVYPLLDAQQADIFPLTVLAGEVLMAGFLQLVSTDGVNWMNFSLQFNPVPPTPPGPRGCRYDSEDSSISMWGYGAGRWLIAVTYGWTYCCNPNTCEFNTTTLSQTVIYQSASLGEQFESSSLNSDQILLNSSFSIVGSSDVLLVIAGSVNGKGSLVWSSTDGVTWGSPLSVPELPSNLEYTYQGDYFFGCGQQQCFYSGDGVAWDSFATPTIDTLRYSSTGMTYTAVYAGTGYGYAGAQAPFSWTVGPTLPSNFPLIAVTTLNGPTKDLLAIDSKTGSVWLH